MTTDTGCKRSALEKVLLVWQGIVSMMVQGQREPEEVLTHIQKIKRSTFRKKPAITGSHAPGGVPRMDRRGYEPRPWWNECSDRIGDPHYLSSTSPFSTYERGR